jgi:N-acetylneuraminic acid mutarotase
MGGLSTGGEAAVYGTLGTAAPGNIPGDRYRASSWTDSSGNFWLFGGNDGFGSFNDFWKLNPSTREWAWMGGSITQNPPGVYGTLGISAAGNIPGGRMRASSWTDSNGNLWLFGGEGIDASGSFGVLNDLWEFNPSANEWVWMGGSSTIGNSCFTFDVGGPGETNCARP